jgi:hypothetical protein
MPITSPIRPGIGPAHPVRFQGVGSRTISGSSALMKIVTAVSTACRRWITSGKREHFTRAIWPTNSRPKSAENVRQEFSKLTLLWENLILN